MEWNGKGDKVLVAMWRRLMDGLDWLILSEWLGGGKEEFEEDERETLPFLN